MIKIIAISAIHSFDPSIWGSCYIFFLRSWLYFGIFFGNCETDFSHLIPYFKLLAILTCSVSKRAQIAAVIAMKVQEYGSKFGRENLWIDYQDSVHE